MTNLTRWNPFREIQMLQNQLNNMFEPFGSRFGFANEDFGHSAWVPPVDLEETNEKLILRAEVPGMRADDINVSFENGVLTLQGERRFENQTGERNFHRVERSYGTFTRSFTLPSSIDVEKVTARYDNGVLELEMPKREEAKPKRIEIKATKSIDSK